MKVKAWLAAICATYIILAGWYAAVIPFGQAPDESAHLPYVAYLFEKKSLPVFSATGGSYEFHQPPLYYALAVPAFALSGANQARSYLAVRWVTILMGLGVIIATYALVRETFPQRTSLALAAAAFSAFLPMHVALCASITNDILAEVIFACVMLLCVVGLRRGWSVRTAALAGALTGLGLLAKSAAAPLLMIGWLALFLGHTKQGRPAWKPLILCLISFTAAALAVSGWWLARNQVLYGDVFAAGVFMEAFKGRPTPDFFFQRGFSLAGYLLFWVGRYTFASSWGVFGNMDVFMPWWIYVALGVLCVISAAGVVRFLLSWKRLDIWHRQALMLLGFSLLLELVVFLRFNMAFFQAQARYLFPVLPVWAMLICLGLGQWAGKRRTIVELAPGAVALIVAVAALPLWIEPRLVG